MGVDTKIMLPSKVRARTVSSVLGRIVGFEGIKTALGGGAWYTQVEGISINNNPQVVGLADITWDKAPGPRTRGYVAYHFEVEDGGRLLMPPSTAFWLAVGHRLVDFFGGKLDYNDCDNSEVDYKVKANPNSWADDGKPWDQLQQRIMDIEPLTVEEIKSYQNVAAYPHWD